LSGLASVIETGYLHSRRMSRAGIREETMSEEYRVLGYRWVNMLMYVLVAFMAGLAFMTLAPLLEFMAERWSIGFGTVSSLMSIFGVFMVLLSIPTGYVTDRVGFKLPVAIGGSLLALGIIGRTAAGTFGLFTLVTIVAGVGWGIMWSPVGALAATWFPHKEIGLASSLWPAGLLAGMSLGSLTAVPVMMQFGWTTTWLVYGVIALVIAGLAWVVMRARPPVPPEPRPPFPPTGVGEGIKQTMNRTNVALQYAVFGAIGSLAVAPGILPPMFIAKGVAPPAAGMVATLLLVGGVVGTILVPPMAFGRRKTRAALLLCSVVGPLAFVAIFYAPIAGAGLALAGLLSFVFGFSMAAVMGISPGVGNLQPGVNPGNAGILMGVFLTSIGIGVTIFPLVAGMLTESVGVLAAAWLLTILPLLSLVVIYLFVPEPEVPHGAPPP
jgi:ACS family hexuronate transporter-like MFS transporter